MVNHAHKLAATIAAALALAVGASACADTDTDTCTPDEARAYDDDCGYWADDGNGTAIWLWYVWVTPWEGGTPSKGVKPQPPAGAKTMAPPPNKPAPPPKVNNKGGGSAPKGSNPKPPPPPPPRPPVKVGK